MRGSFALPDAIAGRVTSSQTSEGIISSQWFAVQTRHRFEKRVVTQLEQKGCEVYLPVLSERHTWSDRHKDVTVPLFPRYAFVRMDQSRESRIRILQTFGLVGFVSFGGVAMPVPQKQIEDLQLLQRENRRLALHPFVRAGQRVRVRGGCLHGLEGVLLERDKGKLLISIEAIERSLEIEILGYELDLA
jgi:transcription antitermination factor NusG